MRDSMVSCGARARHFAQPRPSPSFQGHIHAAQAIGDIYDFDLGDRKRLADVKKPGVPGQPNSIRVRVHLAVAPRPVAAVVASAKRPRS